MPPSAPDPDSAAPVPHPTALRLQEENALLRDELVRLAAEIDELRHVARPHLLALYQVRLGAWELRALEAEAECARLKRELELVQAALNRGVPPDPGAIACQLEIEFAAWRQRVREAADRTAAAAARLQGAGSPAESAEFRALYLQLVKRLHPDANPAQGDHVRLLWQRVQAAHAANDLTELRALALLAPSPGPVASGLAPLTQEQSRLREAVTGYLLRIETIRAEPPFTLEASLRDDAWIATRRQAADEATAGWRARADALRAQLRSLFPDHGQPAPGKN